MSPDEEEFDDNEEGRAHYEGGKLLGKEKNAFEDFKVNIIGEKDDSPVHFCDKCELPIKIYGRMIPCSHAFCYGCAILYEKKGDKTCPGCSNPVLRIEKHSRGSVFMCGTVRGCKRTYLSERDLKAHVNHRHKRAGKPVTRALLEKVRLHVASPPTENTDGFIMLSAKHRMSHSPPKQCTMMPPKHYSQPQEDLHASPAESSPPSPPPLSVHQETFSISTRKHSNLIVPIQDESNPGAKEPLPPAPARAHHHPEYQSQPVVSHPHPIMFLEQQYTSHPPLSPPGDHLMSYPSQATGACHLVYSQVSPPPMTSDTPLVISPPEYVYCPGVTF